MQYRNLRRRSKQRRRRTPRKTSSGRGEEDELLNKTLKTVNETIEKLEKEKDVANAEIVEFKKKKDADDKMLQVILENSTTVNKKLLDSIKRKEQMEQEFKKIKAELRRLGKVQQNLLIAEIQRKMKRKLASSDGNEAETMT